MQRPDSLKLPDGRRGRILALGFLAIAVTIFLLFLVLPAVNLWQTLADELPALQARADGYRRLISRQDSIAAKLADRRTGLESAADYLAAEDPAIAAAQAQRELGAQAETSGVDVRTTLTLPPTTEEGFTSIGFQLSVSGSMRSLRDFLYAVEAGQPRLIVDRLLFRPSQSSELEAVGTLYDMTLDLHGYMPAAKTP